MAIMSPEQPELGLAAPEIRDGDKNERMRGAGIRPPSGRTPVAKWDKLETRGRLGSFVVRLRRWLAR